MSLKDTNTKAQQNSFQFELVSELLPHAKNLQFQYQHTHIGAYGYVVLQIHAPNSTTIA